MTLRAMMFIVAGALTLPPAGTATPEPIRSALPDERAAPSIEVHRRLLSTGVELEYAEAGPADGEPVLFLHGYTDSWTSFSPVLDRLPARMRAIVPSQRGHGDSDRPECCYGTGDFAADAVALLDALGIERAAVVGHSMGSFVAQRIAIDHPGRVSRLVLAGSGATYGTPVVEELWAVVRTLEEPVPPEFVRDFQVGTISRPVPPAFVAMVIAESGKLPARVWRDALVQVIETDAAAELERIVAPTLVIRGELDDILHRQNHEELVRRVAGARDIVYEGTGHAIHWEDPERFVDDVEAFLLDRPSAAPSISTGLPPAPPAPVARHRRARRRR